MRIPGQPVFYKGPGDVYQNRSYSMWVNSSGAVNVNSSDASGYQSIQTGSGWVPRDQWVHLAGVVDRVGGQMQIYVNGTLAQTGSVRTNTAITTDSPLRMGWSPESDTSRSHAGFEGQIDEMRLWSTVRTAEQIQASMDSALNGDETGLEMLLQFGEGSGLTAADATTNANHATLVSKNADGITGRIDEAGDVDRYSFSVTEQTLLYVDSLTNNSAIYYSITGPTGTVVNRHLAQADSADNPSAVLLLLPGDYVVTFDGSGESIGYYNLRLLDLADAVAITPGEVVSGDLLPANATAMFQFDATAGERFFFDDILDSGNNYWRLLDPLGNHVWIQTTFNDRDLAALPYTGTYTLLLEGRRDMGARGQYSFNVQPYMQDDQNLTLGAVTVGNIETVGGVDQFSFTLDSDRQLLLDAFTNTSDVRWTLRGPEGIEVSGRNLNDSDSADFSGNPVLDLVAGDYTLTFDGNLAFTGSYSFRLIDLANARDVTFELPMAGSLESEGRETAVFRISGDIRERIQIVVDEISDTSPYWRMIDPYGRQVWGPSTTANIPQYQTLDLAGDYLLLLEGRVSETGGPVSYQLTVNDLLQVDGVGTTQQDFDSAGGIPYELQKMLSNGADAEIVAGGPTGSFLRLANNINTSTENQVAFSRTHTGPFDSVDIAFDFRLEPIVTAPNRAEGLTLAILDADVHGDGGPVTRLTTEPNIGGVLGIGFDIYDNGSVDQNNNHISIHLNGTELAEFTAPGIDLANGLFNSVAVQLTRTDGGTLLTLSLEPGDGSATLTPISDYFLGGYELDDFRLAFAGKTGSSYTAHHDLDNVLVSAAVATAATPELTMDSDVSGNISNAGEVYRYTLNVAQDTRAYFDPQTNNSNLYMDIGGPGLSLSKRFTQSDSTDLSGNPVIELAAGTYDIAVRATSGATSSYNFRLNTLSAGTDILLGDLIDTTLSPGNSTDAYNFSATAGDRIFFDHISRSSTNLWWRLIDPNGDEVFGPVQFSSDAGVYTLQYDGDYTLLMEGRYNQTSPISYSFRLQPVVDSSTAISIGDTVADTLAQPGERRYYTFSIPEIGGAGWLYFDSLLNNNSFQWSLVSESGSLVASRNFGSSDSENFTSTPALLANPGNYTLTVSSSNGTTGDFGFRLLDPFSGPGFVLGQEQSGTVDPGNSTALLTFTATAGQKLFMDSLVSSDFGHWKIIDRYGRLAIASIGLSRDQGPFTAQHDGTYALLLEGRDYQATPFDYRFNLHPVDDFVVDLVLGETQALTIAHPGQRHILQFSLSEETRSYIDVLSPWSYSFGWALYGEAGQIATRAFTGTAGAANTGQPSPLYTLGAGDYQLIIDPSNAVSGDYAIRILDFDAAPTITPGTPVSGSVNPASETDLYAFDAVAGERFFFDRQGTASTGSLWMRLLDPNGTQIANQYYNDLDTFVANMDGRYVVLLEGYDNESATIYDYQFTVFENTIAAPTPILGLDGTPSPDLQISNVSVSAVSGQIQSGSDITIEWVVSNEGLEPALGSFTERVTLRNLASNEIIVTSLVDYDAAIDGDIAVGEQRVRSLTVRLPDGLKGTGDLRATISTDVNNDIAEQNILGNAEINNTAALDIVSVLAPYADLVATDVQVNPLSGWLPGEAVTMDWVTRNQGDLDVGSAWTERLQVYNSSTNQLVFSRDLRVTSGLASAGELAGSTTFAWPSGLSATGRYEFRVIIDALDEVFEENLDGTAENNNTALLEIASAPDLQVQNLRVTSGDASSGSILTIEWDDFNNGAAATPGDWIDRILVWNPSVGQYIVNATVASDAAVEGPLQPGASVARSFSIQLPDGIRGAGELQIQIRADQNLNGQGALIEAADGVGNAESNNAASITATSTLPDYADLIISDLLVPAIGRGGETLQMSWTVSNAGDAATGATQWSDQVILSEDNVIGNADDAVIATLVHNGALTVGESYNAVFDVTLPARQDGTFYLSVVTDSAEDVLEPDTRGDNTVMPPDPILLSSPAADLEVEALFGPSGTARSGDPVDVAWRVRNVGTDATDAGADGWVDRVYLSLDDAIDAGDFILAELPRTAPLAAGEAYSVSTSVDLPEGIANNYRLLVETNANGGVYERGQTDNNLGVSLGTITVTPAPAADLVVTGVQIPADAIPGQEVTVEFTVRNDGDAAARAPWKDDIYLSDDGTLPGSQQLARIDRLFDLAAGESYTVSASVILPDVGDGGYSFIVRSDSLSNVFENGFEENNIVTSAATVQLTHPNLLVSSVVVPATPVQSGDTFSISFTVENTGSGPVLDGWQEQVWLSRDGVPDADDVLLGTFDSLGVTPFDPSASYTRTVDLQLPIDAEGDYFIVVQADSGDVVRELADESDNVAFDGLSVSLAPYADLIVSGIVAPELTIGDPARVEISWTVTNQGTGRGITDTWTDVLVASRDAILGNNDDVLLGSFEHSGGLDVNQSYSRTESLLTPPAFNGRFNLFVRSDSAQQVFENGFEQNNIASPDNFLDVIPIPYADLVVDTVTTDATALSGQSMTISWSVRNTGIGLTNVSSWYDRIYLSTSPDGSGNRVSLGSFNHIGFLSPEQSYTREAVVTLADGLEGDFYIVVETPGTSNPGSGGTPFEHIYTDNNDRVSTAFQVTLAPPPDLVVTDVVVPETAPEGSPIDVSWTVRNQGTGDATGSWTDRIYLRKFGDTGNGSLVGSYTYNGPLEAGREYSRRELITVPSYTNDVFEVIIRTDALDTVYEHTSENNNELIDDAAIEVSVLPRPDLQVSQISGPTEVDAGATASIEFVVINQGTVPTDVPNWTDRVYLSLDDKITSDDVLVSNLQNVAALAPGESYSQLSGVFKVPERFRGTVYVIAAADYSGSVDEWPNDGNNVRLHELFVNPWPFADLVVSDVVSPDQAFESNEIPVQYTVTNLGAGPTNLGSWVEQIWLTKDKNRPHPGQGDYLLKTIQYTDGVLVVGGGYDRITTVRLPDTIVSGEYYITPWVDPYATLLEDTLAINVNPDDPNEVNNNNYKAGGGDLAGRADLIGAPRIAVIGTPPVILKPDLLVTEVTAQAVAQGTETYDFSWSVRNDGEGTAGSWKDEVYLADQPSLTAPGVNVFHLGTYQNLQSLEPGESYTNSQTVLLNPAAKGTYLIVKTVFADDTPLNNVLQTETDVTDLYADLQVTEVTTEGQADSGEKTLVSYQVTNLGSADVWSETEYWEDRIYLSRDPSFIWSRATLAATIRQPHDEVLIAGASYSNEVEIELPAGADGEWYVYVFTNVPRGARDPFGQTWPVTGGSNDGLAMYTFDRHVYEAPEGKMKRADLDIVYKEPDLQVTELLVADQVAAGEDVEITFTVTNVGTRETREDRWFDRVFLSLDPSLDNGDHLLGREDGGSVVKAEYQRLGKLAINESYTATVRVTMPFEVEGDFNILAVTDTRIGESGYYKSTVSSRLRGVSGDPGGYVREFQDEGNNTTSSPITITPYVAPDIQVTRLDASLRAVRGQQFDIEYDVTNLGGNTPSLQATWDDLIYLSRDEFLDLSADRFLTSVRHTGGLNAGESYTVNRTLTVPTNLSTEAWYVFVVTDPDRGAKGKLFEGDNERNNSRASDVPMVVELPPPTDLEVAGHRYPGRGPFGRTAACRVDRAEHERRRGPWVLDRCGVPVERRDLGYR